MLDAYPKVIITKDGTAALLRPLLAEDEGALNDFFFRIPENERWFRIENVSDPQVVRRWIRHLDHARVLRMVAVRETDGMIIASLSLRRRSFGYLSHIGHLRIMVDPAHRAQRLGTWMLLDMVKLAMDMGVEKLVAELVAGVEEAAIHAAHKLDFFKEAVLHDYVKDSEGRTHDLIIMVKNLHREWSDF